MPERDPDNVLAWRITALEESMKYQAGQLEALRERVRDLPEQLEREYAPRAEVQRDFVSRQEQSQDAATGRDVWTLRIIALTLIVNTLGLPALYLAVH